MHTVKWAAARAAMLCSVLIVYGCGGGGGGGGPQNPPTPPATFTVGGVVSGLAGNSVALRLNSGADLVIAGNGGYTFPGTIASGAAYTVTVQTQPANPAQTCVLANATGSASANVTNVTVTCSTNMYSVRGALSGLAGGSVVLRNNGGDDLTLSADGNFQFATSVASGSAYAVTVQTNPAVPAQTCVVTQGSGNVAAANVTDVAVNCTTNSYTVGGTVSGLTGAGLVLRNNGGNDLALNANGAFTFTAPLLSGANYLVTVQTEPAAKRCTVANADGPVLAANITNVTITCVNIYTISGSVRGLDVPGLVLRNSGGDDLTINANGAFSFATPVPHGSNYNVTAVAGTPASPRHVCEVTNGADVATANVTDVEVTCEADRFAYVAHISTTSFSGPGLISALVMNHETGVLAPIAGTATYPVGNGAAHIVSDPRGRFIYVAHTAAFTTQGSVSGFSVNPTTGALTPVPGSPYTAGMATGGLAIDSEGKFLYATNRNSDDVSGWVIQANGSLTPVPGSPYDLGDATTPAAVATAPVGHGSYVYVAHNNMNGVPFVSAFTYHGTTGALTELPGSPFNAGLSAYSPSSLLVNAAGDTLYMANSGTSNISTFDIAAGAGTLTQRAGSPTSALNAPRFLHQARLSPSLFVVSSLSYQLGLFGHDPVTFLPTFLDSEDMFAGSYCSVATDPYGEFAYVPQADGTSNYLFGFRVTAGGTALESLTLNTETPPTPTNIYTLPAQMPCGMAIRYSRRDREVLQVPE
jgi:6-phosphogluconolactonase (cycloisomerase 2 family)